VTATHVLDEIVGDTATLMLRKKNADGTYSQRPWAIAIRKDGKELYVKNPTEDVAVLYVNMPDDLDITIIPIGLLGGDEAFTRYEIYPGDELRCLGYPLYISSPGGFPILRSGAIASYPLVPSELNRQIYFDLRIYEGNSGGPVYFIDLDRIYQGSIHLGETIQFVVGLVSAQLASRVYNNQFVELGVVIPSSFVLKTIDLLPTESPYR
jgi:hypothetical protein